jgi:hypothetical protein
VGQLDKRLEKAAAAVKAKEPTNRMELQFGKIARRLPPDYQGPKHLEVIGKEEWSGIGEGLYLWAEAAGPEPDNAEPSMRIELVSPLAPEIEVEFVKASEVVN